MVEKHRGGGLVAAVIAALAVVGMMGVGCGGASTSSVFEGPGTPPPSDGGGGGGGTGGGGENPPPVDQTPTPATAFTLGTYYYPWWNAAEWAKGVTGASRYGQYSSDDPVVAGNHITDASTAGIGVFAVNWFGGDSDRAMREGLLSAQNLSQIQFCIHYDIAIRFQLAQLTLDLSKPVPRLAFERDIQYLADSYMNHPQYFRVGGRPVLMIYLSRVITGDLEGALQDARDALHGRGIDVYIVGDEVYDGNFNPSRIRLYDAVTAYNLYNPNTVTQQNIQNLSQWSGVLAPTYRGWDQGTSTIPVKDRTNPVDFIPNVIPQYNDTAVRCCNPPIPSSSFEDFSNMLDMARSFSRPVAGETHGLIWITSWNEWHEGTTVEPSAEGTGPIGSGNYLFGFLQAISRVFPASASSGS